MGLDFPTGVLGGYKYALFRMDNGALYSSTGISSITRNTTATYTINFSTNMSAQGYAVTGMGRFEWSFGGKNETSDDYKAGSCAIRHGRYGSGVGGEMSHASVMINGSA
tara:strand:- start:1591 stop:1917 length:327 start_codon:yes stop_codon:yes gene_type:complete